MIKKIYLTHHTHMDIGYTDLPEEVMNQQRTFLDRAVRECRRSPQYRWSIESAHLLKDYLEHRPQESRGRHFPLSAHRTDGTDGV